MNWVGRINANSRIVIFSIVSIVLVLMLLIGNTYSIFVSSNIDENLNVYKTGNLDITYTLSEDNVNFLDVTPTSIEDSIKIKPYRITVNNAGTVPYMFDLKLLDTTSTDVINYEYIMVQVGKLDPISLNTTTNNIIKEDIIVPAGDSVIVDVRVWLSNTVKNTEIGKSFYAKLMLDGLAIYDNSSDIDNSVLQANRLLSEMEVGSYVLYTGNNGCVGEYCSGVNANSSETSNGYCADSLYQYNSSGWMIAYNSDGSSHIVSAGAVECMCTNSDGTYQNTRCSTNVTSENLSTHYNNMNLISLEYCNQNFSYLGMCNNSTSWSINAKDFEKITGSVLSTSLCNHSTNDELCGYNNSLIDNGGYYWFATPSEDYASAINSFRWTPINRYVGWENSKYEFGVRPVIKFDTTVVVTGGTGTEDDPYVIENIVPNSLKAFNDINDTSYFHNEAYRTKIKNISFVDYIDTSEAVASWDMSRSNNESIIAWVNNNTTSGYYDLYIGSEDVIKGINLAYYFSNMTNVDSINFDNLDTSITRDMQNMFRNTGYDSQVFTLDLGDNFDTSSVENMEVMFYGTGYNTPKFTLDLGDKFDTSNVTNMRSMFLNTGYNSTVMTLDLGDKFDTSNVVNMEALFAYTGYSSPVFTLDLGSKFNTKNVENMTNMFYQAGHDSMVMTLDLGSKFDTSKVTKMNTMFCAAGYNSPVFTLDLGSKFDTSNVTTMFAMFYETGYKSTVITLDLGDKFNTSNVTNMSTMFTHLGRYSTVFTLDLGDKFDTSSVTNMVNMFNETGYNNTSFTLDLGDKFDTSNVTSMESMFWATGANSTVFTLDLGSKFNTSKVTAMNGMFGYIGSANSNLVLDLSSFTFDNVTNYDSMFYSFKTTQKVYVKNTTDQTWITSKGFSNLTTSNVLVKS